MDIMTMGGDYGHDSYYNGYGHDQYYGDYGHDPTWLCRWAA